LALLRTLLVMAGLISIELLFLRELLNVMAIKSEVRFSASIMLSQLLRLITRWQSTLLWEKARA
jgi:hypothetical protein